MKSIRGGYDFMAVFRQHPPLGWVLRYSLAVMAVTAGIGLRLALEAMFGVGLPIYITFYPAVMVVALVAGFRPGLVTTALVVVVVACWLAPPPGPFSVHAPVERIGLGVFAGIGLLMSTLAEFFRRNRAKVAAYERRETMRLNREILRRQVELIDPVRADVIAREMQRVVMERKGADAVPLVPTGAFLRRIADLAGAAMVGGALLVLAGWWFGLEPLTRVLPGLAAMTPNTALCFLLAVMVWWTAHALNRYDALRRNSETQLRHMTEVVNHAHEPIIVRGIGGIIHSWNRGAEVLYGWSAAEALGQRNHILLSTSGHTVEELDRQLESTGRWEGELMQTTRDGLCITVESRQTASRSVDGQVLILESNLDITDRKRVVETLRYQAELLDNVSDAVISTDETFRIRSWNMAAEKIYGWKAEEVLGKNPDQLLRTEYLETTKDHLAEQLMSAGKAEADAIHQDRYGRKRFVHAMVTLLRNAQGDVTGTLGVYHDITERRRSEEALRDGVLRFHLALRNSPVSVAIQDRNLVYQWAYNQQSWPSEEIIGKTDADLFAPDELAAIREVKLRVLEFGSEENVRIWQTSNGKRLFLDYHLEPVRDSVGEISGIGITAVNLTEQKQAEDALRMANKAALNIMQDAVIARQQAETASAALRTSEAAERARRTELETLMDALPTAVFIAHDAACQRVTGNPAAMELLRVPPGRNPFNSASDPDAAPDYEVWSGGRRLPTHELPMQRAVSTGQTVHGVDLEIVFPDGAKRQILSSALPLFDDTNKVRGCIGAFVDLTSYKLGQKELRRLNRTLRALNDSNRAQLHAKTETELLREVCRIITERCGHSMVWIGFSENDPAKTVRPVASAGMDTNYLDTLQISWADTDLGRGPTGTAIRSGQPNQCNDMRTDPHFSPWQGKALKHGFASALALPLLADGMAFGAVTIYARQPAGFPTNEVKLLRDLVGDLALGITTLRLREAQQQGAAALLESEARFRSAFHDAATPMEVKHLDGRILEVNQAYCEMLGYSPQELLASTRDDLALPEDRLPAASEAMRQLVAREITAFRSEQCHLHKNGQTIWCDTSVSLVFNPDGSAAYLIAQSHDITARKQAEDGIRVLNQELESRVLERTNALQIAVTALEHEILNRQRLEREILEISEREQSRLGQDLHDGLGQELAGIAMLCDVLAKQLQTQPHPSAKAADRIATYVRAAIDSTRQLAKGLYPIELDRYGLLLALKDLAAQTSRRTGIRCELRQCGAVLKLEKSAEIHLYRIVQECISNAVKHGSPSRIIIESLAGDGRHTFTVTDDGVGFEKPVVSTGMGLHLMNYRARIIGAEITMDQPEQGGCRITCDLTV